MPLPLQPPASFEIGPTGRSFYVDENEGKKRPDSTLEQDALDAVPMGEHPSPTARPMTIGGRPSGFANFGKWFSEKFYPKISANPYTQNPLKTISRISLAPAALIGAAYRSFKPEEVEPSPTAFDTGMAEATEPWKIAKKLDDFAPPTFFEPTDKGYLPGFEQGLRENVAGLKDFMLSDAGLMASGAAMTPAAPVASAGFALDLLSQIPGIAKKAFDAKTDEEEAKLAAGAGMTGLFGLGAGGHAVKATPAKGVAAKNKLEKSEIEQLREEATKVFEAETLLEEARLNKPVSVDKSFKWNFEEGDPISLNDLIIHRDKVVEKFKEKYSDAEVARILKDNQIEFAKNRYESERMIGPRNIEIGKTPVYAKEPETPSAPTSITDVKNAAEIERILKRNATEVARRERAAQLDKQADQAVGVLQKRIDDFNLIAAERGEQTLDIPAERLKEIYLQKYQFGPDKIDFEASLDIPDFRLENLKKEAEAAQSIPQQKSGSEGVIADSKLAEQQKLIKQGEERLAAKTGVKRQPVSPDEARRQKEFNQVLQNAPVQEPVTPATAPQEISNVRETVKPGHTLDLGQIIPPPTKVIVDTGEVGRNIRERGNKTYTGGEIEAAIGMIKDMIRNKRAVPIKLGSEAQYQHGVGEAAQNVKTGEIYHPSNGKVIEVAKDQIFPWPGSEQSKGLFKKVYEAAQTKPEQKELPLSEFAESMKQQPQGGQTDSGRVFSNPLFVVQEAFEKLTKLPISRRIEELETKAKELRRTPSAEFTLDKSKQLEEIESETRLLQIQRLNTPEYKALVEAYEADKEVRETERNNVLASRIKDKSKILKSERSVWDVKPSSEKLSVSEDLSPESARAAQFKNIPTHSTDIESLPSILEVGLEKGSALDLTPDRGWAGSGVSVVVPKARLGEKIEHNNYYESANRAAVGRVIVDGTAYTEDYTQKIQELAEKHPDVAFEIIGEDLISREISSEGRLSANAFADPEFLKKIIEKIRSGSYTMDDANRVYDKVVATKNQEAINFYEREMDKILAEEQGLDVKEDITKPEVKAALPELPPEKVEKIVSEEAPKKAPAPPPVEKTPVVPKVAARTGAEKLKENYPEVELTPLMEEYINLLDTKTDNEIALLPKYKGVGEAIVNAISKAREKQQRKKILDAINARDEAVDAAAAKASKIQEAKDVAPAIPEPKKPAFTPEQIAENKRRNEEQIKEFRRAMGKNLYSNPFADPENLKKLVRLNLVGKHDKNTWFGTLQSRIAPDEFAIYKEAGLEKFLSEGKKSVDEVRDWIDANGPRVEVKTYGMDRPQSEAKREFDRMTHDWYEVQNPILRQTVRDLVQENTFGENTIESFAADVRSQLTHKSVNPEAKYVRETLAKWSDENWLNELRKYKNLYDTTRLEIPDTSPTATEHYIEISPFSVTEPMPDWTTSKAPKNVQRVDVVIPNKPVEITPNELERQWLSAGEHEHRADYWMQDNLHENLPNTLGWAMVQYKTGPRGEKIAVIGEAQSRWGQERRKIQDRYISRETPEGWYVHDKMQKRDILGPQTGEKGKKWTELQIESMVEDRVPNHPLLPEYNRLILKSAIRQARKEGADHIFISDAETAMLTEGHDEGSVTRVWKATPEQVEQFAELEEAVQSVRNNEEEFYENADGQVVFRYTPEGNFYLSSFASRSLKEDVYGTLGEPEIKIEQEGGMRLNYDKLLPKIAAELTGDSGQRISLGEHKNALTPTTGVGTNPTHVGQWGLRDNSDGSIGWARDREHAQRSMDAMQEGSWSLVQATEAQVRGQEIRSNLIFKNPDGTPKTDVSGTLYNIEKISPDHQWTQFRKDRMGGTPQEGILFSGPGFLFQKEFWKNLSEKRGLVGLTSVTDKIYNRTKDIAGGEEVHRGIRYKIEQESIIRGQFVNRLQNAILGQDTLAQGAKNLATLGTKERNEIGAYLYKKRAGQNPAPLRPELQTKADAFTDLMSDAYVEANKSGVRKIGGEELKPYPKSKGYFPWDFMKEREHNVLLKGTPVPDFNRVKQSVINHWRSVDRSLTKEGAEREFADYLRTIRSGEGSFDRSSDFAALRKSAGRGLPLELADTDVLRVGEKYFHRYAKDVAWQRMENEVPGIGYVLGKDITADKATQAKFDTLREQAGDAYKDWLDLEFNPKRTTFGDIGLSLNRLGGNLLISATAPVRDIVQLMAEIPAKVGVADLPSAIRAFRDTQKGLALAQESGIYQRTFAHLKDAAASALETNMVSKVLDSTSILLRKIRGRDLKDKKEAVYLASLADHFVRSEILKARNGEKEAIQNITNIGDAVTGGVDKLIKSTDPISKQNHLELIHGFVESVRGRYDARALPRYAIKGWAAPFVTLMRWSISKSNQFRNELVNPALRGNWKPLLRYTLGAVVAGATINQFNELINKKRRESPTIKEAFKEGDLSEKTIAVLDDLSLAGYGGLFAQGLSMGMEAAVEHDPQAAKNKVLIGAPALEVIGMVSDSVVQLIQLAESDEDIIEGLAQIGASLTQTLSAEARIVNRNLFNIEDAEERSDSRDVRTWEKLRDFPGSPKATIENAPLPDKDAINLRRKYGSQGVIDFTEMKKDFDVYADKLSRSDLGRDPEKVYNKLAALKSAQIHPNIPAGKTESGANRAEDFANFIGNTQSEEAKKKIEDKQYTNRYNMTYDGMLDNLIKSYMVEKYGVDPRRYGVRVR